MPYYKLLTLGASIICVSACSYQFLKIFIFNKTLDPSKPRGNIGAAIRYSFTGAMSPLKKETAYGHLPTYIAGIIYHAGTFTSFIFLVLHFVSIKINGMYSFTLAFALLLSSLCGFAIFLKRVSSSKLRSFSNMDDYASNLLVTGFQVISAVALIINTLLPFLFIYACILFLYIPLGKLKHTIYIFSSRIHLGIFFGRRGVWPINR